MYFSHTLCKFSSNLPAQITVEWHGVWWLSDNLTYWRENAYPIAFQNHHAGFILTGDGINIDGYGTGGINGNGNAWYNVEKTVTQPGRPMPFVFWNVSEVIVRNFFVKDPPLWTLNIMNGTNMLFENIHNNATAVNAPYGTNWVQNTDGFDTMDVNNVVLRNFVYQGGDDCVAIKPRSYNVLVENATCVGGNGMAIGSLGQYYDINASVENVLITNVTVIRYNNDLTNSAYVKCWIGIPVNQSSYESDDTSPLGPGDGGGYGNVTNITFSDFLVYGASGGPTITEDSGDNGTVPGTSKLAVSNIWFKNFQGYLDGTTTEGEVSCSKVYPCYNIYYENIDLKSQENSTSYLTSGKCAYIEPGGVHGLNGTGCS